MGVLQDIERRRKLVDTTSDLLEVPGKLDELVAGELKRYAPTVARPKYTKYPSKTEAITAAMPADHPMRSLGERVGSKLEEVLASPIAYYKKPKELLDDIMQDEMLATGEDGKSLLQKTYEEKRQADSSFFGLMGENKKYKRLPGYDEWLEETKAAEEKTPQDDSFLESVGSAAAWGAGFGGVVSGLLSGGTGVVPGALAGGVGGALLEIPAYPIRQLLKDTEWYKAREQSGKLSDKLKLFAADIAPDILLGAAGAKAIPKLAKGAAERGAFGTLDEVTRFKHFPSVENAIRAGRVARRDKLSDSVIEETIKGVDAKGMLYDAVKSMHGKAVEDAFLNTPETRKFYDEVKAGMHPEIKARNTEGVDWFNKTVEGMQELAMPYSKNRANAWAFARDTEALRKGKTQEGVELTKKLLSSKDEETAEHVFKLINGKAQAFPKGAKTGAVLAKEAVTILPDYVTDVEAVKKAFQGFSNKPGLDMRDVFKGLDDEYTEVALRQIESGVHPDIAARNARTAQDTVQKIAKEQERLAKAKALDEKARIAETHKTSVERQSMETEGRITNLQRQWEREHEGKLKSLDESKKFSDKIVAKYGVEGSRVADSLMDTKAGEAAVQRMRGVLTDEDVKELGFKGVQEAEDGMLKAFGEKTDFEVSEEYAKQFANGVAETAEETTIREGSRNAVKSLVFPLLATGAVAAAAMFSPDSAEASVLSSIGNKFPKIAKPIIDKAESAKDKMRLMMEMSKANWDGKPIDPNNPFVAPPAMEQMKLSNIIYDQFENIQKAVIRNTSMVAWWDRFMSPHAFGRVYYAEGANPANQLAHAQTATVFNTGTRLQVMDNILSQIPGYKKTAKAVRKEIIDTMTPLAERYSTDIAVMRSIEAQLVTDQKVLAGLKKYTGKRPEKVKKVAEKLAVIEARIPKLQAAITELKPTADQYLKDWEESAKLLAEKHSAARVALAAEDTADFKYYPWLRGKLSSDEQAAVARIQEFHNDYAVRMQKIKLKPIIDRPYVHHAWHPKWSETAAAERMKMLNVDASDILPYSKFFHRGKYSRMMVPEIGYTMERYIPDAERRIQWATFWGKGDSKGWAAHMRSNYVQGSEPLRAFWNRIKAASIPAPATQGNIWANRYTMFEVLRLIGYAPSVAFKHFFKNEGTMATIGVRETASHYVDAASLASRVWARRSANRGVLKTLGFHGPGIQNQVIDQFVSSYAHSNKLISVMGDLDINSFADQGGFGATFDNYMRKINDNASVLVGAIESFDRAHSVLAAIEMSHKRGMTAQQAMYGIFDTILKNNFLGGALNPGWMKDPKVRMAFLFQTTPFKIWERRLINAYQTGRTISMARKELKGSSLGDIVRQMAGLKTEIRRGEDIFKTNVIKDAMSLNTDFFGTPVATQLVREMVLSGLIIGAGATMGMDFEPQVGHLPFLNFDSAEPSLRMAPIIGGGFETMAKRREARHAEEDPDFFVTDFFKNWLGNNGIVPITMHKMLRLSENDIPEIYKEGPLKYMFSVPAK